MIYIAVGIILISAGLLIAEMFIPGFGIFGISGIVGLVAGIVLTALYTPYGFLAALIEIVLVGGLAAVVIRGARRRRGETLVLNDELTESGISAEDAGLAGKSGKTVTPLKPFGVVDIEGKRVEAASLGEFIGASVDVTVTAIREGKIRIMTG